MVQSRSAPLTEAAGPANTRKLVHSPYTERMSAVMSAFRLDPSETSPEEPFVGEVRVTVEIENVYDREMAERGLGDPARIRRLEASLIVDTGSILLALPEDLVDLLGLRRRYRTQSQLADGTLIDTWVAGGAAVHVLGRMAEVECVVLPAGSPALLGQVPLEVMDLLVDCRRQTLAVNPQSPDIPRLRL